MPDDSLTTVVGQLVDALEGSDIVYAFGGALALAAWSEPRATADVDLILWIGDAEMEASLDILKRAGVDLDNATAVADAKSRGMFVGRAGHVRVDVFVPSIPFYEEAKSRRVATTVLGRDSWVHSAEVLAVFKMLFFRSKDLVDIERMLRVQGKNFDRAFVRKALVEMLEEDERILRWDDLCIRVSL